MFLFTLLACEKESRILTMDEAVKRAEKIIKKYPARAWYASKNILEAGTVLHYSQFGISFDEPGMMQEYTSPDYNAWLVMLGEDFSGLQPDFKCLHIFINAETGRTEQVWLDGQAIVEWGSDPFSRHKYPN